MTLGTDDFHAPLPFGPFTQDDWSELVQDLPSDPSRGQRVSIAGDYYVPFGLTFIGNDQLEAAVAEATRRLQRQVEDAPIDGLSAKENDRLRRLVGLSPIADEYSSLNDEESVTPFDNPLYSALAEEIDGTGIWEGRTMWGRWLDPAQQQVVRENGRSVLGVITVLDTTFAEHLDLRAPDADNLALVLRWTRYSWDEPSFRGERIETVSMAADREHAERTRPRPLRPGSALDMIAGTMADVAADDGAQLDAWRSNELATVPLRLLTPRLLTRGLERLGLHWSPIRYSDNAGVEALSTQPGLYTWVDNLHVAADPLGQGILYVGIGVGANGVAGRVRRENAGRRDGVHAHGLMLKRRNALALLGGISDVGLESGWLDSLVANNHLNARGAENIARWRVETHPVACAEQFAIRLSIHLGDTVAPVNSQYARAWADDSSADWAAFAAAQWLALSDLGQTPDD